MPFDAIVVGARCAGSPTAMLLARRGHRVLLLDRARFPSDIMSTHLIKPCGVARLAAWALLDRLVASKCPPITEMVSDAGDAPLSGCPPPRDGFGQQYAPRRVVLDHLLVEAAVESGAELREGFRVDELLRDGDRVVGIRGRGSAGAPVEERAPLVIGADGIRSVVARAVDAPSYDATPALACWYYAYWSGIPLEVFRISLPRGRAVLAFPTHHDLVCILVGWPRAEFDAVRADIEGHYLAALEANPELAAQARAGRRAERFVGTAEVPNFFRCPWGPGWALVGDAGYHRDPLTGWGIADAFRDAELLAEAVDEGARGARPLDEAMAAYEAQRNAAAKPYYDRTVQAAALTGPAEWLLRFRGALRSQPREADRFMGAIAGTVPLDEFWEPDNVARILAVGARDGSG